MKKEVDLALKKQTLIASIVASAVWLVSFVIFIPLACMGKVPNGASRYLSYVSVLVMIWIPFILVLLRVRFDFSVLVAYLVFIFLATLAGSGWSVYQFVSWYDTVIHFFSGVLIGLVGYTLISRNSNAKLEYVWLFIFIVGFTMLGGGIWEIYEFAGDCLTGSDMQITEGFVGQKAVWDTMIDIVCDFVGGIIAATCCMFWERKKRRENIEQADRENPAENKG